MQYLVINTLKTLNVLFYLFFFSCQSNPMYMETETPLQPFGITVNALSGGRFQLSYYIQNEENTFDGYNIYITRESTAGDTTKLKASTVPYSFNGGYPTLIHSATELDLENTQTVLIENFMIANARPAADGSVARLFVPFESGTRYFFKLTSHTFNDNESADFSNEVSAVALP